MFAPSPHHTPPPTLNQHTAVLSAQHLGYFEPESCRHALSLNSALELGGCGVQCGGVGRGGEGQGGGGGGAGGWFGSTRGEGGDG